VCGIVHRTFTLDININSIRPTTVPGNDIFVTLLLNSLDVISVKNQILEILDDDITVVVETDVAASTGSTKNYGSTASAGY